MLVAVAKFQDIETQEADPLPSGLPKPSSGRQRIRGCPPNPSVGRGKGRAHATAAPAPSRHQPRNPPPVTPARSSKDIQIYQETLRQLDPDHRSAMQKLGATILSSMNGADVVDLLVLGHQLSEAQLFWHPCGH